jgi:hypothetical protein
VTPSQTRLRIVSSVMLRSYELKSPCVESQGEMGLCDSKCTPLPNFQAILFASGIYTGGPCAENGAVIASAQQTGRFPK